MKLLFCILLDLEYLDDDIQILKEHLASNPCNQIVFLLKKKNGKTRQILTKEFGKYFNDDDLIFDEYNENFVDELIEDYLTEYEPKEYLIIHDGLPSQVLEEEEPINIEEL